MGLCPSSVFHINQGVLKMQNSILKASKQFVVLVGLLLFTQSLWAQKQAEEIVVFPPPPDTVRIQYLTRFSSSIDITGKRSGFLRYILGEDKGKPIIKPYGIAIHKGRIYIADTILGGLEIIDLNKKTFDYFRPRGLGILKKPINCFVDTDGFLYVADAERRQIVIFDPKLKYVASIGDARKIKPTDVFVYKNKIYFTDLKSHRIWVYSKISRDSIFTFPEAEPQTEPFLHSPINLYIYDDEIYVTDFGEFKVKIYDMAGEYLRSVGSYGRGLGQFVRPKGIAVDKEGNLYVVDAAFENVQIFDKNGKLLMFFGGTYQGPGYMWLPAKVIIDYDNLKYFQKYVYKDFKLKYLIFVTNQYGPDKISVYGFVEPKIK